MRTLALRLVFLAVVKRGISSAKIFAFNFSLLGKSLMQTRKRSGPRTKP